MLHGWNPLTDFDTSEGEDEGVPHLHIHILLPGFEGDPVPSWWPRMETSDGEVASE